MQVRTLRRLNFSLTVLLFSAGICLLALTLRWVVPLATALDPDLSASVHLDDKLRTLVNGQTTHEDKANDAGMATGDKATWVGAWAALLGVFATGIGFGILFLQLRREERALETQTSWTMYGASLNVLDTFVQNPELRPYFYDNAPLPGKTGRPELRSKVLAAAEIVCDHLENIVSSGESGAIDAETYFVWAKYMRLMGLRSQVMVGFLSDELVDGITESITTGSQEIAVGEGQRYCETFKRVVREGIVPSACRKLWKEEMEVLAQGTYKEALTITEGKSTSLVQHMK